MSFEVYSLETGAAIGPAVTYEARAVLRAWALNCELSAIAFSVRTINPGKA